MIAWLLACTSGVPEEAAVPFGSPADAEDLDPADDIVRVALTAAPLTEDVAAAKAAGHDEETTTVAAGYAYNGQVPGPTLRAKVGDTVIVELTNDLDVATTIHWHGLVVPAEMDGVTWMHDPVEAGGTFTYEFTVDRAGTYWYHPHLDIQAQVESGLYGAFVVEDPEEPVAERELIVVWQATSDGDVSADDGEEHEEDTGHADAKEADAKEEGHDHGAHDASDPGALRWTANGEVLPTYTWDADERVRVRMINAAARGYLALTSPGARRIGGDQGLLAAEDLSEGVVLAPGDRAEFEWTGPVSVENALYTEWGGRSLGATSPVLVGDGPAADPLAWPFAGDTPSADPGTTDAVFVLSGGGDEVWLINGEAWPDVTAQPLALGQEAVIEVRNLSAAEHPFHLHGHRFELLSTDGVAPAVRTVEDTVNVPIRARMRLRVVPTEPGDWMVHCHLLPHEENGMMTIVTVE